MIKFFGAAFAVATLGVAMTACGQSNDLACDSSGATDAVINIVKQKNPYELLTTAIGSDNIDKQKSPWSSSEFYKWYNDIVATASYSLKTIRMEDRNATTGAVTCAAKLGADIPNYGGAEEDIEYKVEKTTDGNLYVTIQDLQ
ncbi:MAG TPA: hypothetical protein VGT78_14905 [Rhizomicrobium sp.]|nr:hypothetical protein [Rhizomicrobium sp.]